MGRDLNPESVECEASVLITRSTLDSWEIYMTLRKVL